MVVNGEAADFRFKRSTLVGQVADAIRADIVRGAWQEWIPSEREISQTLGVSRNTCRKAIRILCGEQLVRPVRGCGLRIEPAARQERNAANPRKNSIGVLLPKPYADLSSWMAAAVGELGRVQSIAGIPMQVHVRSACFGRDLSRRLENLVRRQRHRCWVLVESTAPLQQWFADRSVPCVIWGETFAGIDLPCVSWDYRAACRHAAGKLISLGHDRLALLQGPARGAPDVESPIGFFEGVRASSRPAAEVRTWHHDGSPESILRLVRSPAVAASHRPTGWLIADAFAYVSAVTGLSLQGLRTPADLSMISLEDDPLLRFFHPEPARYTVEPMAFVRKLAIIIRRVAENGATVRQTVRVMPRFVTGGSCAPLQVPAAASFSVECRMPRSGPVFAYDENRLAMGQR